MRYEEMIEKPEAQVMRLADFLGCSFTEEEKQSGMVEKILELCSLGGVGDWKNHLTNDMARKLDEMVEKKLEGSGLKFE
ncbi:hypothetical protein Bca52824_085543 [Brassica carinata]|nr:hypothetical protein Bca52824_085543 [Brassica carinata]